jgi:hypothetical protein
MSKESRARLREERAKTNAAVPGWINPLWLLLVAYGGYVIYTLVGAGDVTKLGDKPLTIALIWLLGALLLFMPFTAFSAARGSWRKFVQVLWVIALICTSFELIYHSHIWQPVAIHNHKVLGPIWEGGLGLAVLLPLLALPRMSLLWPFNLARKSKAKESAVAA